MKFFDLHCDTADEIFLGKKSLYDGDCHVSLKKAEGFDKYVQLFAVFTYPDLDDNAGFEQFLKIRENFLSECEKYGVEMIIPPPTLRGFIIPTRKSARFSLSRTHAYLTEKSKECASCTTSE